MAYYEFTIRVSEESKDALLNRMSDLGCLGATDFGSKLMAYFKDSHDIAKLRDELAAFRKVLKEAGLRDDFEFDYFYLSERDWNDSWKKKFVPVDAGERFSILPPWETPRVGRVALFIDPGMAFGTGHHETTKACIALIEKYSVQIPADRFLDVGTGTGILAIAASKAGFSDVVAVDIDPLAVDAAIRNAGLNGLRNIVVLEGTIREGAGTFDMVVANLMSEILIGIAREVALSLKTQGIAILSGMLTGQEGGVRHAVEEAGLTFLEQREENRWVSLVFVRGQ